MVGAIELMAKPNPFVELAMLWLICKSKNEPKMMPTTAMAKQTINGKRIFFM